MQHAYQDHASKACKLPYQLQICRYEAGTCVWPSAGAPRERHSSHNSASAAASDATVGAKNMHSSSGCAVTRRTLGGASRPSCIHDFASDRLAGFVTQGTMNVRLITPPINRFRVRASPAAVEVSRTCRAAFPLLLQASHADCELLPQPWCGVSPEPAASLCRLTGAYGACLGSV